MILKRHWLNILLVGILILMLIPYTRQHIQVIVHKGIALINPVKSIAKENRDVFKEYNTILINEQGKGFSLSKAKDKVIVINFWATWCAPCIAEMPSFQELYDAYKDEVVFLFISTDDMETVSKFKKQKSYTFPVFHATEEFYEHFEVSSIPKTFIINKQGEIVINKSGAVNWYSQDIQNNIATLLNE